MPRRVRIKLLKDAWTYGDEPNKRIPAGVKMILTEAEATEFLKDRRNRSSAEVIEILDDSEDEADTR